MSFDESFQPIRRASQPAMYIPPQSAVKQKIAQSKRLGHEFANLGSLTECRFTPSPCNRGMFVVKSHTTDDSGRLNSGSIPRHLARPRRGISVGGHAGVFRPVSGRVARIFLFGGRRAVSELLLRVC